MNKAKPLELVKDEQDIDRFAKKIKTLGFDFRPIGKPEGLLLETVPADAGPRIELLSDSSRVTVDEFLKEVAADGALVLGFENRQRTVGGRFVSVVMTLLPYRLEPLHQ